MNDLGPGARALLAAARVARPSAAARARIDTGLLLRIAAPPAPSAPAPPPPPAPVALGGGLAAKVVLVAALSSGAGAGGAALWTAQRPPAARPRITMASPPTANPGLAIVTLPSVPSPRAEATPIMAPPLPEPAPPRARPRPAAARAPAAPSPPVSVGGTPTPPAAASAGSLGEELAALHDAQKALKRGDGAGALAKLDALDERRPEGVLGEERLAARVLALCAAGRAEDAREAGRRFVAEHPGSVQMERVRASCAFARPDGER